MCGKRLICIIIKVLIRQTARFALVFVSFDARFPSVCLPVWVYERTIMKKTSAIRRFSLLMNNNNENNLAPVTR